MRRDAHGLRLRAVDSAAVGVQGHVILPHDADLREGLFVFPEAGEIFLLRHGGGHGDAVKDAQILAEPAGLIDLNADALPTPTEAEQEGLRADDVCFHLIAEAADAAVVVGSAYHPGVLHVKPGAVDAVAHSALAREGDDLRAGGHLRPVVRNVQTEAVNAGAERGHTVAVLRLRVGIGEEDALALRLEEEAVHADAFIRRRTAPDQHLRAVGDHEEIAVDPVGFSLRVGAEGRHRAVYDGQPIRLQSVAGVRRSGAGVQGDADDVKAAFISINALAVMLRGAGSHGQRALGAVFASDRDSRLAGFFIVPGEQPIAFVQRPV